MVTSSHLNLATVREILKQNQGNDTNVLDLGHYQTADIEVFSLVGEFECEFVELGLTAIDIKSAEIIASWKSYGLVFSKLAILEYECAEVLANSEHLLAFENEIAWEGMSLVVASTLAKNQAPVHLHLKQLSREVAMSLAINKNELCLTLDSQITEGAAHALLSRWEGFRLHLRLPSMPSPWTLAILKRMQKQARTRWNGSGEVVCEIQNDMDMYKPYRRIIGPSDPYEL